MYNIIRNESSRSSQRGINYTPRTLPTRRQHSSNDKKETEKKTKRIPFQLLEVHTRVVVHFFMIKYEVM